MKRRLIVVLALECFGSHSAIAHDSDEFKRVDGVYQIYGGSLGYRAAPTAKDKKIVFALSGSTAREIFNAIGPDRKDLCTEGTGARVRKKNGENLVCMRTKEGEYFCSFGFDLVSGKSIGGSIC